MTRTHPAPLQVVLFIIICIYSHGFELRQASDQDVAAARKILFSEAMNPLSLRKENLLVAVEGGDNPPKLLGFGQIRPLGGDFAELASLFVIPEKRKQGIGGALVTNLLERHNKSNESSKVCLLTLKPTASFYESFGFEVASKETLKQLPSSLQAEYVAGSAISLVLGNEIVCMVQK